MRSEKQPSPSRTTFRILVLIVAVETAILASLAWMYRGELGGMFAGEPAPPADGNSGGSGADNGDELFLFTLKQLSTLPDPATAPYANCLAVCAAEFHGAGKPVPVALAMPAFLARRWTTFENLKEGAVLACKVVPYDDAPAKVRRVDIADTIGLLDVPMYYCASWTVLGAVDKSSGQFAAALPEPGALTVVPAQPISQAEVQKHIAQRRQEIAAMRDHSGGWDAWGEEARATRLRWVERARASGGAMREAGKFYFEPKAELGYAKAATYGKDAPAVRLLIDLHQQLAATGVHLIAVPFPQREEVTFRYALEPTDWPTNAIAAPRRQQLIDTLLAEGVDVVDVLPWLLENEVEDFPFYDCADGHPASGGIVSVARGLSELLSAYGIPLQQAEFERQYGEHGIPPYLATFPKGAKYRSLALAEPVSTLKKEPSVLLIGDSYLRTPGSYGFDNATLFDHLCWELGREVSHFSMPAPEVFQALRRNRHLREAASVVVFVFSPSYFTKDDQFRSYLKRTTAYQTGSL